MLLIDSEEAETSSSYYNFAVLTWQKLRQLKGNKRYFFFLKSLFRISICTEYMDGKNNILSLEKNFNYFTLSFAFIFLGNRPFPKCFELHCESEANCKVFIMKISFHS